jgi:hypothetical protein
MGQPRPFVVDSASQSNTQSPVDSQDLGTHPHLVRRNAITPGEVERLHQHVESLEPGEQQRRIKRINRDANIVAGQLRLSSASNPPTQPQSIEAPANTTVTTHHVQLLTGAIHEFMIRFFQDPSNQDLYVPSAQQPVPEGTIVELRLGFRRQFVSQEGERILNERLRRIIREYHARGVEIPTQVPPRVNQRQTRSFELEPVQQPARHGIGSLSPNPFLRRPFPSTAAMTAATQTSDKVQNEDEDSDSDGVVFWDANADAIPANTQTPRNVQAENLGANEDFEIMNAHLDPVADDFNSDDDIGDGYDDVDEDEEDVRYDPDVPCCLCSLDGHRHLDCPAWQPD